MRVQAHHRELSLEPRLPAGRVRLRPDLECPPVVRPSGRREPIRPPTMRLIRRRDHAVCSAEIVRIGGEVSMPILLIEGTPFPAAETVGYFLADASAAELAELRRGGYALLRAVHRG